MAYEEILYDVTDRVATLTLNRPTKLNAWTPRMEKEVQTALFAAEKDDVVRVIIVTGAGRAFCAGADIQNLEAISGGTRSPEELRARMREAVASPKRDGARPDYQRTYSYLASIGKPLIAAVNGPAVGLGMIIAMYCDLRFASDQAKFSTAFARRGLIAEHGLSWMLPRQIGLPNALDLLFSARLIDAAEAHRMGFVSRVLPQDKFLEGVRAYATEIATMVSPRSTRIMKKQIYEGLFQTLSEASEMANEELYQSLFCEDFREGVAHFVQKRAPAFTGK